MNGVLHKIRESAIEQVLDRREWKVRDIVPVADAVEDGVPFSFFGGEHLIGHEITAGTPQIKFLETMRDILQQYTSSPPAFNPLDEPAEFMARVRQMQKVTRVRISDVHRSNPEDSPDWRKFNEWLDKEKVKRASVTLHNDDGLDVRPGSFASQGMSLAARGYGDAEATGMEAAKSTPTTVTTYDKAIRRRFPVRYVADIWAGLKSILPEVKGAHDSPASRRRKGRKPRH